MIDLELSVKFKLGAMDSIIAKDTNQLGSESVFCYLVTDIAKVSNKWTSMALLLDNECANV